MPYVSSLQSTPLKYVMSPQSLSKCQAHCTKRVRSSLCCHAWFRYRYQAWQDSEKGRQKFTRDGVETTIEILGENGVSFCAESDFIILNDVG